MNIEETLEEKKEVDIYTVRSALELSTLLRTLCNERRRCMEALNNNIRRYLHDNYQESYFGQERRSTWNIISDVAKELLQTGKLLEIKLTHTHSISIGGPVVSVHILIRVDIGR